MQGLMLTDNEDFLTLFAPILAEFHRLWWYVDVQSGPFDSMWVWESEENERRFEQCHIDLPICENTSARVYRPGTLPELAPHMYFDEWSYLVGFEAEENQVESIATEIFRAWDYAVPNFFAMVQQYAAIYIMDIDDNWINVYSPRTDWLDLLRQRWTSAQPIDSNKWLSFSGTYQVSS